jgi:hypothetical protein
MKLKNMRLKQVICNCDSHCGELVQQIEAQLPNGKPIVIMKDWAGYHVAIGERNQIGNFQCPPGVSEAEAEQIIRNAMQGK